MVCRLRCSVIKLQLLLQHGPYHTAWVVSFAGGQHMLHACRMLAALQVAPRIPDVVLDIQVTGYTLAEQKSLLDSNGLPFDQDINLDVVTSVRAFSAQPC